MNKQPIEPRSDTFGFHFNHYTKGRLDAGKIEKRHVDEFLNMSVPFTYPMDDEDAHKQDELRGLAEGFGRVLLWCWTCQKQDGTVKLRSVNTARNHFAAASALIRPELFSGMTYKQVGKRLGVTRQQLSHYARKFQKDFNIHFRRSHKK